MLSQSSSGILPAVQRASRPRKREIPLSSKHQVL
jgi:hypothetical protein